MEYRAGGSVKAALALDRGRLFFGDYDGRFHAIDATNGRKLWTTGTSGARFGLSLGQLLLDAGGRLRARLRRQHRRQRLLVRRAQRQARVAQEDRRVRLLLPRSAVAYTTVYIGSYDKKLYALDARSGRVRWSRAHERADQRRPAVIGDLVFVSNLGKRTYAFGARTGQPIWETNKGAFNPAISDGERIYLVGYSSLFALDPAGIRFDRRRSSESDAPAGPAWRVAPHADRCSRAETAPGHHRGRTGVAAAPSFPDPPRYAREIGNDAWFPDPARYPDQIRNRRPPPVRPR